jgi:hypothetical protein
MRNWIQTKLPMLNPQPGGPFFFFFSFFVWNLTLDLSGMGDPANSYITTGIALEIMGSHKPSCHDKAETSLGGE